MLGLVLKREGPEIVTYHLRIGDADFFHNESTITLHPQQTFHDETFYVVQKTSTNMAFVITSLSATVFLMITAAIMEDEHNGLFTADYHVEDLSRLQEQYYPWNFCFWVFVSAMNSLFVALVVTPIYTDTWVLIVVVLLFSTTKLTGPREGEHMNITESNLYMLALLIGFAFTWSSMNLRGDDSNEGVALCYLALSTAVMVFGHRYDQTPPMNTILNFRLIYVASASLVMIIYYIYSSHPILKHHK